MWGYVRKSVNFESPTHCSNNHTQPHFAGWSYLKNYQLGIAVHAFLLTLLLVLIYTVIQKRSLKITEGGS